jgi:excisionase family DNA binding protein
MSKREVERYLTTSEVAEILHCSSKSVTRWATEGKLPHSLTLGGHRRFPESEIEQIAEALYEAAGPIVLPTAR